MVGCHADAVFDYRLRLKCTLRSKHAPARSTWSVSSTHPHPPEHPLPPLARPSVRNIRNNAERASHQARRVVLRAFKYKYLALWYLSNTTQPPESSTHGARAHHHHPRRRDACARIARAKSVRAFMCIIVAIRLCYYVSLTHTHTEP